MTHSIPEINILLKQLRLSHMAESLPRCNREAIESKLAYPEFLSLLLQSEMLGRTNHKLVARMKRANIRSDKTIENFDFTFNPKINRAHIQELASCRFIAEKTPILMVGPCGTGKSHLAHALAHCAIRQEIDVLCLSQNKLFSDLQAARASGRYDKKIAELSKVALLIIDDFGLRPLRTPQDEDLHDLISARYEHVATIITSNLDFSEWGNAFPNQLLAAATLDRLRHHAHRIVLEGASYRGRADANSSIQKDKKMAVDKGVKMG